VILITGLGPGDLARVSGPVREVLLDPTHRLVVRTRDHPAAAQLAALRDDIVFCDDLYEASETFEDVYSSIADRVIAAEDEGSVVYAVPGGPGIGEFAVREILDRRPDSTVIQSETFLDAVLDAVGYDPFRDGLQILNAHALTDPIVLDKPTIVGHLDRPEVLADVASRLSRVLPEDADVTVFSGLGSDDAVRWTGPIDQIDPALAGFRTSLWIDAEPGGLIGVVHTMEQLRRECPWDREQTHISLAKNLIEESYELIDAISRVDASGDEIDWVGYSAVEEELGDVLLQVLFHAAIGRESGMFDIDSVAEVLRQKLVRRHPHVFSDVVVDGPEEVKANWDRIKSEEKGSEPSSVLDGVPTDMPALYRTAKIQNRASKAGFDWSSAIGAAHKAHEEMNEVLASLRGEGEPAEEIGDLLFSVVGLCRQLGLDPELALRVANHKFEARFRQMEADGDLKGLDEEGLRRRWSAAKKSLERRS